MKKFWLKSVAAGLCALSLVACGKTGDDDYNYTTPNTPSNNYDEPDKPAVSVDEVQEPDNYVVDNYEKYHEFFMNTYFGKFATEYYVDITHDGADDLVVTGLCEWEENRCVAFIAVYTVSGGDVVLLDYDERGTSNLDGHGMYHIVNQGGLYYIAHYDQGVWTGLGLTDYEVYWFDNLNKQVIAGQSYKTRDNLTDDEIDAEIDYAFQLWDGFYKEYKDITNGAYLILSDWNASMPSEMIISGMSYDEFCYKVEPVGGYGYDMDMVE